MTITAIFLLILTLSACKGDIDRKDTDIQPSIEITGGVSVVGADFETKTYNRDASYARTFHMSYYNDGEISVGFLEGLYSDNELSVRVNQIKSDYEVIKNELGVRPDMVDIYILDETLAGGAYMVDNIIFCDQVDFETGAYRKVFLKYALNISDQWIIEGIYGMVFGDVVDTEILANYYESTEDMAMLSLSYLRFQEEINTEEALEIARETSVAMASFVVDHSGFEALEGWMNESNINMWLRFIGTDISYSDPYDGVMYEASFEVDDYFLAKAQVMGDTIYIDVSEGFIEDARDMEAFIYKAVIGHQYVIDYLTSQAPSYFTQIYDGPITFYLSDDIYQSQVNGHGIRLNDGSFLNLLTTQVVLEDYTDTTWTLAVLKNYIARVICPNELNVMSSRTYDFLTILDIEHELYAEKLSHVATYMVDKGGNLNDYDDFDASLYYDGEAYVTFENPDFLRLDGLSYPLYDLWELDSSNRLTGDELTYFQLISFAGYLIETYSLDRYINLYETEANFKGVYGKDFNILKLDWIEYLQP